MECDCIATYMYNIRARISRGPGGHYAPGFFQNGPPVFEVGGGGGPKGSNFSYLLHIKMYVWVIGFWFGPPAF